MTANTDSYKVKGLHIDFKNGRIVRDGRTLELSQREVRLLKYFLEHSGEVLSRDELLRSVWGYSSATVSRTVDMHIVWLRQKIEEDPREPQLIVTVYGQGYRFDET
jgi:DNA-binding response OmpR family regulator